MQEEITQKTLALCVEASKMTAQLLQQAMKKVLADMENHKKNPPLRHGKQTLRQLMKHNTSVSNIEITDQNMAEQTPDSIITTQRNGQTIVAELFFNHSSTETFRDKLLKLVLADSSRLSASDGQEPEKTEILR